MNADILGMLAAAVEGHVAAKRELIDALKESGREKAADRLHRLLSLPGEVQAAYEAIEQHLLIWPGVRPVGISERIQLASHECEVGMEEGLRHVLWLLGDGPQSRREDDLKVCQRCGTPSLAWHSGGDLCDCCAVRRRMNSGQELPPWPPDLPALLDVAGVYRHEDQVYVGAVLIPAEEWVAYFDGTSGLWQWPEGVASAGEVISDEQVEALCITPATLIYLGEPLTEGERLYGEG